MISICVPTRGRPDNVRRLMASVLATSTNTEVVFYADEDDDTYEAARDALRKVMDLRSRRVSFIRGPRIVMSDMWNKCAVKARGEILMLSGDDCVFRTPGWDVAVETAFEDYPDRIVLVYGDDKLHGERMATHPFIHREWVNTVGRFTPPYFSCDWPDTWLHEVAKAIGRTVYLPGVVTEHMHPAAGKGEWDQTHQERSQRGARDDVNRIYTDKAPERAEEAALLRAKIQEKANGS